MRTWTNEDVEQKLANNPDLALAPDEAARRIYLNIVTKQKINKYHVAPAEDRTYNGKVYASKKEMLQAQGLDYAVKAGKIDFYLEQVPFRLPGETTYRLDFATFKRVEDKWEVHFIEVKGKKIRLGEIKRAQTEELFGIHVEVI